MFLSLLKLKYVWEVYTYTPGDIDSWPTLNFLTLESFKNLPLNPSDKSIEKNKFQPENGDMPYRQITTAGPNTSQGGGGGAQWTTTCKEPSCLSARAWSLAANTWVTRSWQVCKKPSKLPTSPNKFCAKVLFLRVNVTNTQSFETMSGTYQDPATTMGQVFDEIWIKDTSPVFLLTEEQEKGLMEKKFKYKMYISSEKCATEKPYTEKKNFFPGDTIEYGQLSWKQFGKSTNWMRRER